MKPRVIVAPDFRKMTEVFDPPTLARLEDLVEVVWGRDGPMPQGEFVAALADATAVVFGTWHYGRDAIRQAGDGLRKVFEVAGSHHHPDLDYETCFGRGIAVGSCAPACGPAVAESKSSAHAARRGGQLAVPGIIVSNRGLFASVRGKDRLLHPSMGARFAHRRY